MQDLHDFVTAYKAWTNSLDGIGQNLVSALIYSLIALLARWLYLKYLKITEQNRKTKSTDRVFQHATWKNLIWSNNHATQAYGFNYIFFRSANLALKAVQVVLFFEGMSAFLAVEWIRAFGYIFALLITTEARQWVTEKKGEKKKKKKKKKKTKKKR